MTLSLPGQVGDVGALSFQYGALLTQVRLPGAARHVSPRFNFPCTLADSVNTALVRNRMH